MAFVTIATCDVFGADHLLEAAILQPYQYDQSLYRDFPILIEVTLDRTDSVEKVLTVRLVLLNLLTNNANKITHFDKNTDETLNLVVPVHHNRHWPAQA